MSRKIYCLVFLAAFFLVHQPLFSQNCNPANLEMAGVTGTYPTGNGPSLAPQVFTFSNNVNNPADNVMSTYAPTTTVTFSLSNQQFNSMPTTPSQGMAFGRTFNTASALTAGMGGIGTVAATSFTSSRNATGVGLTAGTAVNATSNVGTFLMINDGNGQPGTNQRPYYGDLTITFSTPVDYPIIHFNDFGGITAGRQFTSEYQMTSGYTMTKLSGSGANTVISGDTIKSTPQSLEEASIRINGTGITTITFKVYLKTNATTAWPTAATSGEAIIIGVSVPRTVPKNPILTKTTLTNACPSTTVNLNSALPTAIAGQSYEWHNVANGATAGSLISNPTTYSGASPVYLFAKDSLTGCYSLLGDTLTVNTVNCTYTISCSGTTVFREDFGSANDNLPFGVSGAEHPYDSTFCINGFITKTSGGYIGTGITFTDDVAGDGDTGTHFLAHFSGVGGALCSNAVGDASWLSTASINVVAGQTYEYSYYYRRQNTSGSNTVIQQQVVPVNGTITTISSTNNVIQTGAWVKNTMRFVPSANGPVTLRLNNMLGAVGGNDFALDNIALEAVVLDTPNLVTNSGYNTCPNTTANLINFNPTTPLGLAYEWHTVSSNPSAATLVTNPTAVGAGKYYVFAKSGTSCLSDVADSLTITIYNPCLDCDNDGVPNQVDIDDDNDGVLDVVEMNCEKISNGYFNGNVTLGWTYTGNVAVSSNLLNFNSGNTAPNGTATQVVPTVAGQNLTLTYNITASAITTLGVKVDIIDSATNVVLATKSIIKNVAPASSNEQVSFVATGAKTKVVFTDISTVTAGVDIYIDNVSMLYCDNDNDGIPNSCDTDSDNDGCPDAVEAGATTIKTQSTFTGPYGLNGLANSIENNDSITASVANEPFFFAPNYGSYAANPNTIICADDCDNDGIPNEWDIDDDNDGVLDAIETCNLIVENFGTGTPAAIPNANTLVTSAQATVLSAIPTHPGNAWFAGQLDRTPNDVNGNMLFIYNVSSPTVVYTRTISNLVVGRKYNFSAYIANPMQAGWMSPNITFIVRDGASNAIIGQYNTGNILNGSFNWQKYGFDVIATSTSAKIEIVDNVTSAANNNLGQDDIAIDDISFGICDFDNDGIPNNCDTDDDNDGCPTAFEAGATSSKTQFTFAGPYGVNGLANSLENNDSPTASTSYSSTYLTYGLDSSSNGNKCNLLDCDNDGIPNITDIDDDNDGILDVVENNGAITYTGAEQSFVVPCNVTQLNVKLWGAGGGGSTLNNNSGGGGFASATIPVTPGETLTLIVGEGGKSRSILRTFGGGGAGGKDTVDPGLLYGASGGGRTEIRRGSTTLVVAGGGGGSGYVTWQPTGGNSSGGAGGGTVGLAASNNVQATNGGGKGGTQTAGGAGGVAAASVGAIYNGQSGTQFQGGDGGKTGITNSGGGGGGGGGWYGGGGGSGYGNDPSQESAGGGGSGYTAPSVLNGVLIAGTSGTNTTIGLAGNNTDPNYVAGIGVGAPANQNGGNGLIFIAELADADNDGIPNSCDLDSDGDGCPDAVEAGTKTLKTDSIFTDPVGANGLANSIENKDSVNASVINVPSYSLSNYTNNATSCSKNICNDDCDNDGVPNIYDLDDDNDGVLDLAECPAARPWRVFTHNRIDATFATNLPIKITGSTVTNAILNQTLVQNDLTYGGLGWKELASNVTSDATQKIVVSMQPLATTLGTYVASDAMLITNGIDTFVIDNSTAGYSQVGAWTSQNVAGSYLGNNNYISQTFSSKTATWTFNNIPNPASSSSCDKDNDGNPNICDTDDDGDGCPTAFEAGATSNPAQTTIAGPYGANGLANSLENNDSPTATVNYTSTYSNAIDSTIKNCPVIVTPDTNKVTPACPTCPINSCVVADDLTPGGQTYTSCGTPNGYTAVGPDANGCITYTPNGPNTTPDTTCIIACKNGVCDTTIIIINPPVSPDTNKVTPACPTCPINTCVVADDLTPGGQTYTSCGTPNGYTAVGPDANGCITYTPNGPNTTADTTCIIACKNGVCDTTVIIINPPVSPDTNKVTPACPTCPINTCVVADDLTPGGQTYTSCGIPNGYTAVGPDANGCITYTPNGPNTTADTTCIIACKNGVCDTTFIIINPPVTPDTVIKKPACPTCPVNACVVADDLTPGGQTYTSCGTPNGYTAVGPDANGCITYTPNGPNTTADTTCIIACKNGVCDTTFIIINPPVTPDTVIKKPACPTCPVNACVVADDLTPGGQTYTSCGTPNGYTAVGPDANGCITYTPNGPNTTADTTCIIACKNGVCDTTYVIINPPVTPDTVIKTPTCPTCPVSVCQVINDVSIGAGATFSSCPTPAGYTATPTDVNGCKTYTPNGINLTPDTTCQVICKNGICDTTYIIINPPVSPDTNSVTPPCPTCPINSCVVADDLTPGGQTYTACAAPAGYTQTGPDANGCITLTPLPGASSGTTCVVACKNGKCDTTYIIINPPVTPDTNKVTPACPSCPINTCVVADDLTPGGQSYSSCGTPNGYTAVGPDANGCITYTPNGPNTTPDTTCIIACKNGKCDTTYIIINPPITPDTVMVTPNCPTCPVNVCQVLDDIPSAVGATFSSCPPPAGYTVGPINANGCKTFTPNGINTTPDTTCQVICKNGICDTTYIIINPPITPDTVTKTPACPTCPINACVVADDLSGGANGATFSTCPPPPGYTVVGPDANGCVTYTGPSTPSTTPVTTCIVACKNGKCDTTFVIINPPVTPDTTIVTPACPTCSSTACVVADNLTPGGQTYTSCGTPNGYTAVGPDANGCITYTPNGPNTTADTTCIVACKNGTCDTTYIIINPPVEPDTIAIQPTCPTCPVLGCVTADDIPGTLAGATFSTCGLSPSDVTKGQITLDLQGCIIWVGNGTQSPTDTITTCVVACKNGVCDTTYINILPAVPPYGPDSIYSTPPCASCPTPSVCPTGDDIPSGASNQSYTSCGLSPADASKGSLNFNSITGCAIWTPNGTQTDTVKTCVVICAEVTVSTVTVTICDTTYIFYPPSPKPDTVIVTPACPTCPITPCPTADDLIITSATTFSTCGTPSGYTATGPNAAGCMTYTSNGVNTTPDTTCVVACNGTICDTTYVIINPPVTPDTVIKTPACPTCPVQACVVADDLSGGATGASFSTCPPPPGYTAVGPNANGCVTYTGPSTPSTVPVTTCIVACKNGICDTTYVIINPPVTPDTVIKTPSCATCPVTACVVADNLTNGTIGASFTTCPPPAGFTAVGPDANGCVTYTGPSIPNTVPVTTCIVACNNGVCDTTYVIINPPATNVLKPDFNTTFVNVPVTGDISTNDVLVDAGTTYGSPSALPGNPSPCLPTIASDGTYSFVCNVPGEFNFLVPVCPPGITVNCPTTLLTITVLDQNSTTNLPTANPDYGTTKQDTPITIDIKSNDKCNNGPNCTLGTPSIIDNGNQGTATINPDGTLNYVPNPGFVGKDTILYAICDNQSPISKCDTDYVFIDVLPSNAPNSTTAMDDYNKGGMGEALPGNVKTNDTDPEADNQSVTPQNITIPGKGSFVLNADGSYIFTPVDTFKGPIDIPYTTCDDGTPQACAEATLHILILQPDVTPNITATPNIMHGTTTFNVTVKVTELNMVKTKGTITVRIPKDNRLSFTYNPAAVKIGFTNVSNAAWTYNGSNPFFHVFTTTSVIPKGGFSTFGFVATFAPGNTDGKYTMTSTISSGSGSENRTNNNTDAESLDYFHD